MPYTEEMAKTMRPDLGFQPGLSEKKMFGGLCFLLHDNLICDDHAHAGLPPKIKAKG